MKKIDTVIQTLSLVGVLLALYLFYNYIAKPLNPICSINDVVNCDAVTTGVLRNFLGLPVPLFGLIGYLAIFAATFYKKYKLALGVAVFGTVFCLRLTILEIFVLKVVCPVCLACQIIMLAVTALLVYAVTRGSGCCEDGCTDEDKLKCQDQSCCGGGCDCSNKSC